MLYKKICAEGPAPSVPFSTDFFGLTYHGNLNNSIEFSIFYYGAFEKPLLYFLRDTLKNLPNKDLVFCDIGANIGQHSLFMSKHVSKVHAFEPFQQVSGSLRKHIELNKISNIQIHNVGLSNKNEQKTFFAPTGRNQGIGSFDAATVAKGNEAIGQLALIRGDDYFKQQQISNIALVKIDVEGFEKPALAGLQQTLTENRPIVVFEITYGEELSFTNLEEIQQHLPADYELFTFNTRKVDGSKARRRGLKAKKSGTYSLIPFQFKLTKGQDDIVACPAELGEFLPHSKP
ncbi:MAG: FkbM family methyltransferase [Gammaproteobacteria bacterium]|nr:FkbM family methyltransferase [Gammaproteobacteria bacterium]MDP7455317.1 FkbM family methyltransferase [Gammaproteobacteria bacterium]HJO12578.1 FkbM family methyltransferase [Gammaproteobacteria bacterium]